MEPNFAKKFIELNYINLTWREKYECVRPRPGSYRNFRNMRRSKKGFRPAILPVKVRNGKTNRFITTGQMESNQEGPVQKRKLFVKKANPVPVG